MIQLPRNATPVQIRNRIIELKSDSNDERSIWLSKISAAIGSDASRQKYACFGDYNFGSLEDEDTFMILIISASSYILYASLCFLLTLSKRFQSSRSVVLLYCLGCFIFEAYIRLMPGTSTYFVNELSLLPFELIHRLHSFFPALLSISMVVAGCFYFDVESTHQKLMQIVLQSNAAIMPRISELLYQSNALTKMSSSNLAPEQFIPVGLTSNLTNSNAGGKGVNAEEIKTDVIDSWTEFMDGMTPEQQRLAAVALGNLMPSTSAKISAPEKAKEKTFYYYILTIIFVLYISREHLGKIFS